MGVTTALVAYKTATIATEVAHKGLKGAIMATAAAEKALQLVQAATPWGLLATAVAGLTAAIVANEIASKKEAEAARGLTAEEQKLSDQAQKAAEAFREQKAATDEALGDVTAEMAYTQTLADELLNLADASGKVEDTDKERAQFILNELNEALGTEYSMTGNVINKYKDLKKSIDDVIQSKTANALLEAANGAYVEAVQNEGEAFAETKRQEKAYTEQKKVTKAAEKEYLDFRQTYQEKIANAKTEADYRALASDAQYLAGLKSNWESEEKVLAEKKEEWDASIETYEEHQRTINTYEEAQAAALSGNYEKTVDLLSKKGSAYKTYSEEVDKETAKTLATLEKEAVDAGIKAKQTKENFENGVAGYTKKMVTEAEKSYQTALGKFGSAYSDAYGLGEDFGQGIADGIKIKDGVVGAAAIAQIRAAVKAAKKEAEIKSPSRVARKEIGAQLGEGNALGIEDKTKDVKKAASNQMAAVLDAYRDQEVRAQKTIRNLAEQQSARQVSGQMSAASVNSGMLEKILTAIEKGQILTIDGDSLVGATANRMDNALGRRRDLAARGAL